MRNLFFTILIFSLFISISFSQEISQPADTLQHKKNPKIEHSMAFLPVMGFDYTLAYQQSKHLGFGFSVRYGLTGELIITHPSLISFQHCQEYVIDDYSIFTSPRVKSYVPLLGLSMFYRNYFVKNVYMDAGIIASVGYSSVDSKAITDFTKIYGGYLSINYGFDKIKFGQEFQIAAFDTDYISPNGKRKPLFLFIPLIIRISL